MNFLFLNFNVIFLSVWAIMFIVALVRVLRPLWVKNIAYSWLISLALGIHILWGVLATIGQYLAFNGSEIGKVLLSAPLPKEVPFPSYLEWVRPLFDGAHGYFAFYSFSHYFLITIALFILTGSFVLLFTLLGKYRPLLFKDGDIAIAALAFLISGWYGALVLIPLGVSFAILVILLRLMFKEEGRVSLPTTLLAMAPVAFVFAIPLLSLFGLYPLLKL